MTEIEQETPAAQSHAWADAGFDLVSMRIILAAAIEKSFARAAEREFTSLSAVSRRVGELEKRIGINLFDRHERGVALTNAGTQFVSQLGEVFERLEGIADELEDVRAGRSGVVRISAPMTPCSGNLPQKIKSFIRNFPGIHIQIIEETAGVAMHSVAVGEVDLALVPETPDTPNLQFTPFFVDHLVIITPPDHPFRERSELRFADVLAEPIIGIQRESGLSTLYRQQAKALGGKIIERAYTTSFESVRRMVAAGLGIAILPATAAQAEDENFNTVILPLDEEWARRPLMLCTREADRRSAATNTFLSWLFPSLPN